MLDKTTKTMTSAVWRQPPTDLKTQPTMCAQYLVHWNKHWIFFRFCSWTKITTMHLQLLRLMIDAKVPKLRRLISLGSYTSLVYFLCRCYRRHRSLSWPSRNMVSNLRRSLSSTQRGISRYLSLNMLVSSNSLKQFTSLSRSCTLLTLVPP